MFNEQATVAYRNTEEEVLMQIDQLQARLIDLHAKAKATNTINWGHVGDMTYILSQLKELNGEEDE
jgi:hypothetical protein